MIPSLEPLRVSNLKDACVLRLEELILSGELNPLFAPVLSSQERIEVVPLQLY